MYEYLFSQDSLIIRYRGMDIIIVPGQACHVRSKRIKDWVEDGHVVSIFKTGVYVSYGHSMYFSGFSRGNTKWIPLDKIAEDLRFPTPRAIKPVTRYDLPSGCDDEPLPS